MTVKLDLTKRETEISKLVCVGFSSEEIAQILFISTKTVRNHRYHIYQKADTKTVPGLLFKCLESCLFSLEEIQEIYRFKKESYHHNGFTKQMNAYLRSA